MAKKILIIENDPQMLQHVADQFKRPDGIYETKSMRFIDQETLGDISSYDAVIVAYQLKAALDGVEIAKETRKKTDKPIPIILHTRTRHESILSEHPDYESTVTRLVPKWFGSKVRPIIDELLGVKSAINPEDFRTDPKGTSGMKL